MIKLLLSLLGSSLDSEEVQSRIETDELKLEKLEDLEEGQAEQAFLESYDNGYSISFSDGVAVAVFLKVTAKNQYAAYRGDLPFGLSASSSRTQVREKMGEPLQSAEPHSDPILGDYGAWDKYEYQGAAVHFQFRLDENGIELVTLMNLSSDF